MITFTIENKKIVNTVGIPKLIFSEKSYDDFIANLDEIDRQFPGCIFGCYPEDEKHPEYCEMCDMNNVLDTTGTRKVVFYGIYNDQQACKKDTLHATVRG